MIYDVIYSLFVLTEKLAFFQQKVASVYYILKHLKIWSVLTFHLLIKAVF